jgi:hypothetical protein
MCYIDSSIRRLDEAEIRFPNRFFEDLVPGKCPIIGLQKSFFGNSLSTDSGDIAARVETKGVKPGGYKLGECPVDLTTENADNGNTVLNKSVYSDTCRTELSDKSVIRDNGRTETGGDKSVRHDSVNSQRHEDGEGSIDSTASICVILCPNYPVPECSYRPVAN